jgi:hypothetical protein
LYLVSLVVELLVVLGDLGLLGVIPNRQEFIELAVLAPGLGLGEPRSRGLVLVRGSVWVRLLLHLLGEVDIEFSCSQETKLFGKSR